jgi:16S rRNA processing protein RimM
MAETPKLAHELFVYRNQSVVVPDGYMAVGCIVGVHGLRGELKVELHTDFPERFAPNAHLRLGEALIECTIVASRMHKTHVLLQLKGITRREQAEALRGQWLFVPEEDATNLEEGAYWVHEIIGLEVESEDGRHLGEIADVIFTGANEVYVVRTPPTVNRGRELLLPAIDDVVRAVDLPANRMVVHLLPGLLEE